MWIDRRDRRLFIMTRYHFMDSLRGFALFGILLVNVLDITEISAETAGGGLLDYTVQSRFVPIFTLLFGVSMYLIADGARRRGVGAWQPLMFRMLGLGLIGVVHSLAYGGDILRAYAIVGLIVMPLVVWAPALVNVVVGCALTVASFGFFGGGFDSLPGLLLVGAGAAQLGVPAMMEKSVVPGLVLTCVAGVAAIPLMMSYISAGAGDPRFSLPGARAGLAMALAYIGILAVAWQWAPIRAGLRAVFDPLGKMSLTNYVSASFVVLAAAWGFGLFEAESVYPALGIALVVITVQSVLSRIWLWHFRYGPLEWVLRALTWRNRPPFRRRPTRTTELGAACV
jgi:uncharacterized protein